MSDLDKVETWMRAEIALIHAQQERERLIALLEKAIAVAREKDDRNRGMALEYAKRVWGVHPLHPRLPLPLCVRAAWSFVRLRERIGCRITKGLSGS